MAGWELNPPFPGLLPGASPFGFRPNKELENREGFEPTNGGLRARCLEPLGDRFTRGRTSLASPARGSPRPDDHVS